MGLPDGDTSPFSSLYRNRLRRMPKHATVHKRPHIEPLQHGSIHVSSNRRPFRLSLVSLADVWLWLSTPCCLFSTARYVFSTIVTAITLRGYDDNAALWVAVTRDRWQLVTSCYLWYNPTQWWQTGNSRIADSSLAFGNSNCPVYRCCPHDPA